MHSQLQAAAVRCRQQRCELTLLLVEIDAFDQQLLTLGPNANERLRPWLAALCATLDANDVTLIQVADARWAILIPNCDRKSAVDRAGELMSNRERTFARLAHGEAMTPTLSVGAATLAAVPANFSSEHLWDSAERCLYAARTAGGGMTKSIEIY